MMADEMEGKKISCIGPSWDKFADHCYRFYSVFQSK